MERKGIVYGVVLGLLVVFSLLCVASSPMAQTEPYPNKTVTIIVPWAAGGSSDLAGRMVAKMLSEVWKQPVIVLNQPGASGVVGSLKLAGAEPDGYTLGLLSTAVQTTQYTSPNPTDRHAYTYISGVNFDCFTMTVRSDSPWKNLKEYLDYAKGNPAKVTHASSGVSATDKLVFIALTRKAAVQMTDVPFEGYSGVLTALLGKKVTSVSATLSTIVPYLKSGEMRVLAVSSDKRSPQYPDIPTFREAGVDLSWISWNGILGPKGIPAERVASIQAAMDKAFAVKEWKDYLASSNLQLFPLKGDQFKSYVDSLDPTYKETIEAAGLMRAK